nr:reverse transcriptase domain-containing protein [Tanacetum cinerariifolium]
MKPRPKPNREATPTLWTRSLVVCRQRERVVGFEEAPNREGSRRERNAEGIRPSKTKAENRRVNLPSLLAAHLGRNKSGQPLRSSLTFVQGGHQPLTNMGGGNLLHNGMFLSHHAQPFIPSSLRTPTRLVPIHVNPYSQPSRGLVNGQTPSFPFQTQIGNPPTRGTLNIHPQGGICHRPSPTMVYLHTIGSFTDSTGSVTPFVHWIEDYPFPDRLKMPSHIGSYDGKGDPDNFLHLFEGAIRMQKWEIFERSRKSSWDNNQGPKGRDRFSPYRRPNQELLSNLFKSPKEIIATEKAARSFEQLPRMFGSRRSRDMSKYCHFHEDYGHDTNDCHKLRNQIEEAIKSGQLSHLVKGIKKEKKMEIVVSTIHRAIKFHTTRGIGMVFLTHESDKGIKKVPEHFKGRLRDLLRANADVFAWTHADMIGIPRTIIFKGKSFNIKHKLNEYTHVKPIKQKRRGMGLDRNTTACKEVEELMKAGILQVKCQTWVANPVMTATLYMKLTGRRRGLLLPKDAFWIKECWSNIQKLVDKVFHDQIGRNLEAYVDDMEIKSKSKEEMLADIKETFEKFRSINMKLNSKKCSFGIEEGPFLGYLITKQGIRANPSKVKAITNVEQLKMLKDIQSLNGKIATLSHFLSKGAKRSLPFFKAITLPLCMSMQPSP